MTYETEKEFEIAVIAQLIEGGWKSEVIRFPTEEELIQNWANILFENNRGRDQLNGCPLTRGEMDQIIEQIIALRTPVKLNDFINGKSVSIRRDNPDDQEHFGLEVSLKIYDRQEIANGQSRYQIVQQPKFKTRAVLNDRRGDLMLLINGMPVIHMELKRSGVSVSRAYNQIEKYAHEGVFTGLFSLIQVFVAMEPEETVYFANPGPDGEFNKAFYFHWANFDNEPINDWKQVVSELLNIPMAHTLIGFYTIPDAKDNTLKVMRSYQYYAATRLADRVTDKDWSDTNLLGGHIWHTTGSGKTLTSFKSAQLIASWHDADKVVFLVDRKALGRQSFDDFKAFAGPSEVIQATEDGTELAAKLKSDSSQDTLIVTSIQKLSNVTKDDANIRAADMQKILSKRIVIIIDEAHRSTFGEMLSNIKATFKHSIIFGFTGTPIQDVNKKKDNTTTTVFGDELHRYTLADGIRDKNVLGFDPYMVLIYKDRDVREKVALMKAKADKVEDIFGNKKKEKAYYHYMDASKVKMAGVKKGGKDIKGIEDFIPNSQYEEPTYRQAVLQDILDNWVSLSHNGLFHAIFATSSIPEAVAYYRLLRDMAPQLNITGVFDPTIDDNGGRSLDKEDGIVEMLEDYERMFNQRFSMSAYDQFREDVQLRLAHKKPYNHIGPDEQINILIVVNQMLTGFDSKWINALYLEKVLEYENLIQAFSRTNRLYGDEKPFGIIKYYRRPHTMARNIEEAVRAYSGDIPIGLFVDKLPGNLRTMNRLFAEISDLFKNAGIENFERLPAEKAVVGKFAKLFIKLNQTIEAATIQGFSWQKNRYSEVLEDGTEIFISADFDEPTYLALLHRYKELSTGAGGGLGGDPPFEIDTHITEIRTDAIDADYMNSRFDKFYKLWEQGGYDQDTFNNTLAALHKSFGMLSPEEQKYANLFIRDIQSGDIQVDPNRSFRDYISEYMRREEDSRIARMVRRLGCNADKLREFLNRKVTEANYNDGDRFNELVSSVDRDQARNFFVAVEKQNYKEFRLGMLIYNYMKHFILTGGKDMYDDFVDPGMESGTTTEGRESPHRSNIQSNGSGRRVVINGTQYNTSHSVKSKSLTAWYTGYGKKNAVACMMDTGCFAYLDEKVCLNQDLYVQRGADGKLHLTEYARSHEDECFLQFVTDEDGTLHYIVLPKKLADQAFEYSKFISEDILKKYGLVCEMARLMLEAIAYLEFGPALKKLMSKGICNYTVGLLNSTTGLDNHTISNLRSGKNLSNLNVVSALLGIQVPYPVSEAMLKLANISFPLDRGPDSNKIYVMLLSTRWAAPYYKIYEDLEAEGVQDLIKQPPI